MTYQLTDEQKNTAELICSNKSVAVQAFAGAAKTTTAKEACKSLKDPMYICFNKHNVEEAKAAGLKAECKTSHSLGYAGIRSRNGAKLSIHEDKSATIFRKLKLKGKLIYFQNVWNKMRLLNLPLDELGLMSLDEENESAKIDDTWYTRLDDIRNLDISMYQDENIIDYTDMLWLPNIVRAQGWLRCSNIIIDELQDTSEIAIGMIKHAVGANTPIIGLGDANQCIFEFAGASEDAFLHATEWEQASLTISFRCPEAVIGVAQLAVPEISAFRSGGTVMESSFLHDQMAKGELILGAKYSDILPHYFERAFSGDRVALRGIDVLENVLKTLQKAQKKTLNFAKAIENLAAETQYALERLPYTLGTADRRTKLNTTMQLLACISAHFSGFEDFSMFIKKAAQVKHADYIFSTIHRSKGCESTNVTLLNAVDLQNAATGGDEYSRRLFYVAVTRCKENLVLVG